jgi:hypothetical protein
LSVFKADFVFQLVFRVFVFVPYYPALFHVFSVLLFALHVKGFSKAFSGPGLHGGSIISSRHPRLFIVPARQSGGGGEKVSVSRISMLLV